MAAPYPDHPQMRGNYAPIRFEATARDLVVEGELPTDLQGSLYRIGPNPQFAPRDDHHWFAGDGMVHAFHFDNGKVDYLNRWVRTPKWELEHSAGRSLFGVFGNPMTSDKSAHGTDAGVANTNIVWHADRLLALEEIHAPFEVDPQSLEARGYHNYEDKLKGAMTAHPKIDPQTGEMHFFSYFGTGFFTPHINYHVVDKDGQLIRSEQFEAPFPAMVHDFIVTAEHVVFPIFPLTADLKRALAGGPPFAWEPDKGSWLGILRRGDPIENLRWVQTDPCFVFHPMNAWSEPGCVVADMMQFEQAPLFPRADGKRSDPAKASARLCRWRIDLNSDTDVCKREYIDDLSAEFPRLDERFAGLPYRHGYYACASRRRKGDGGIFHEIAHIDHETGKRSL